MTREQDKVEIKQTDSLTQWLDNSERQVVILAFTAAWVGSFFLFRGYLEDLQKEHGEMVGLQIIDIEEQSALAHQLGVSQVPTTIVLRNHEIVDTLVGTASRNKLNASVKPHI